MSNDLVAIRVGMAESTGSDFKFDEKDSIKLTALEWKDALRKGKRFCFHRWQYRQARAVGGLKVVYDLYVEKMNLPAGRICSKCGKIEWIARKDAEFPWKHTDFYEVMETDKPKTQETH